MASPPNPRIYLADDFSWAYGSSFANFYTLDVAGGGVQPSIGRGTPRGYGVTGGPSSGNIGWTVVDLDTGSAILSATCGQKFGHERTGTGGPLLCDFDETPGVHHVTIELNGSNHIIAKNGAGTTLGTSSYIFPGSDGTGGMADVEAIVHVATSTGTVQVWVDDILVLDLAGKDTQSGGSPTVGFVTIHYEGGRRSAEWMVHDGSARLGSQWRVGLVPVATAGTYVNGTPTGAATNVEAVDDLPGEAFDTTYVTLDDTSLPKKVSFVSGAMPANAVSIRDVHAQLVIKKSNAGTNTGKIGLKSGATEVYNTSIGSVPDQWVVKRLPFRTNPASGTPLWTLVSAAAAEMIVDRET